MERYEEEGEDSDNETDPEQLLNEWLGELDSLTVVSFCLANCAMIATQSWKRLRFDEMSMVTMWGIVCLRLGRFTLWSKHAGQLVSIDV